MSRLIRALKFGHSPQLMKPALVHTPPRISNPLGQRERGCRVQYQNAGVATRPPCWGRSRIGRKPSLPRLGTCAILLYYPCTQSHGGNAVLLLILLPLLHLPSPSFRKTQLSLLSLFSDVLTPTEIRRMRAWGWQLMTMQACSVPHVNNTLLPWWNFSDTGCAESELTWLFKMNGLIWSTLSSWPWMYLMDRMILLLQRSLILISAIFG